MAGRPKVIQDSKVFDVSKPSRSKPVSTSRPVITQRKDVVDATVNQEPAAEAEVKLNAPSVSKRVIQPLDDAAHEAAEPIEVIKDEVNQEVDEVTKTAPEVPQTKVSIKETPTVKVESEPETETPADEDIPKKESETVAEEPAVTEQPEVEVPEEAEASEEPSESPETEETGEENTETATVEAIAEAAQSKKASSKSPANNPAVQELIDSKKYFVPLAHESGGKASHRGLWVFLMLVLLVAGLYLAADAELLSLDVKLPYEFIK